MGSTEDRSRHAVRNKGGGYEGGAGTGVASDGGQGRPDGQGQIRACVRLRPESHGFTRSHTP